MTTAGHWLTQSVAMILLSKSTILLDCSSVLSLLSNLSLPKRFLWVSVLYYGVFLGRTQDDIYCLVYWPGQSVDYYCQYMVCQCPALIITPGNDW